MSERGTSERSRVVAGALMRGARWYTRWVVGAQLLVIVAGAVINASLNDPVTVAVWQLPAVLWSRYPLVAVGAMLSTVSLPIFIANGVTRREYLRGAGWFGAALLGIVASVGVVGFLAERAVYAVGSFEVNLSNEQPLRIGLVYLLLLASYFVSGLLIGAAVTRWSPRRSPWMITLFVIPLVAGEIVLGTFWGGVEAGDMRRDIPLAVGAPLIIAVVGAAALVAFVLLRDIAIRPKKG